MTPRRIVILFVVVALLSILCISKLKVSYLPATTVTNQISVYFDVAGSDPEQTEALATESLENALSGITGIKKISSVSSYNSGRIVVSFESESDLDYKYFEIMAAVRQLREHLSPVFRFQLLSKGMN
ncbi:efflux RND transporter permease subunit [Mucilaginibacter sp. P25]|uniref:efflux RND transporter permease subunit n=1 Tax=unclassified Mucilaginibacter TaxID=2617802 RepID=UPI003D6749FA